MLEVRKRGGVRQDPKLLGSRGSTRLHNQEPNMENKGNAHMVCLVMLRVSELSALVIIVEKASPRDQWSALKHHVPGRMN